MKREELPRRRRASRRAPSLHQRHSTRKLMIRATGGARLSLGSASSSWRRTPRGPRGRAATDESRRLRSPVIAWQHLLMRRLVGDGGRTAMMRFMARRTVRLGSFRMPPRSSPPSGMLDRSLVRLAANGRTLIDDTTACGEGAERAQPRHLSTCFPTDINSRTPAFNLFNFRPRATPRMSRRWQTPPNNPSSKSLPRGRARGNPRPKRSAEGRAMMAGGACHGF
jgi:hypothetical protein